MQINTVRKLDGPFFLYQSKENPNLFWNRYREEFVPRQSGTLYHEDCGGHNDIRRYGISAILVQADINRELVAPTNILGK